jgi:cobalt-zinc-cadmium efflux system membrane fusion protein
MKTPQSIWQAVGLSALAGLAGCGRPAVKTEEAPVVQTAGTQVTFPKNAPQLGFLVSQAAEPRRLAVTHLTGRVYWSEDSTVRIFSPVMGRVTAVRVDIGQPVAVGAALAEISSPDYGQALADARTAAANLAAVDKAYTRMKDLLGHGAAAQKDVESAEAAYLAAAAERDRAQARLKLYGGADTESGEVYVLRSPVAGMVVERSINPGQEVRSDQMLANAPSLFAPLFVVSDPGVLWLQVDAAESDLPSLELGQHLNIYSKAFPGQVFSGTIQRIGSEMDPSTRTVKVRGVVQNPDGRLKAEMYVSVDVARDETQVAGAGVEIPSKAVFTIDDKSYLFVELAAGRFERRQVQIGTEKDGKIPVLSGVAAGEKVVAEGSLLLEAVLDPSN